MERRHANFRRHPIPGRGGSTARRGGTTSTKGSPSGRPPHGDCYCALVATWKRKLADELLIGQALPSILAKLADDPPHFFLPPATLGHTRHYMPWFKKGPEDKALIFDTFVSLDPTAEVVFHWPVAEDTSQQDRKALDLVLSRLGYFGRAESWSTARLLPDLDPAEVNCSPGPSGPRWETTRVLVADRETWNRWAFKDKNAVKPDPLWNLLADTADMHLERWSDPPGSRWVVYAPP